MSKMSRSVILELKNGLVVLTELITGFYWKGGHKVKINVFYK